MNRPIAYSTDELTGEQALAILRWLEKNVEYMEHGYGLHTMDHRWPHSRGRFDGLTLIEYAAIRMKEEEVEK